MSETNSRSRNAEAAQSTIRVQLRAYELGQDEFTPSVAAILHQGNQFKTLALEFEARNFPSREAALQNAKSTVSAYLNDKYPHTKIHFAER